MFDVKIAVGMGFELGIECWAIPVTNRLKRSMEVGGVLHLHVVWGKVYASAKPPNFVIQFEIPYIHMNDGYEWVVWMDDDGYTRRKELFVIYFERHLHWIGQNAMHGRKIHAAPFNHVSFLDDTRTSAAATITLPQFLGKGSTSIQRFQPATYFILYRLVPRRYIFSIHTYRISF